MCHNDGFLNNTHSLCDFYSPSGGQSLPAKIVLDHVRVYIYIYNYIYICLCALDFPTIGCIRCH